MAFICVEFMFTSPICLGGECLGGDVEIICKEIVINYLVELITLTWIAYECMINNMFRNNSKRFEKYALSIYAFVQGVNTNPNTRYIFIMY